MVIIWGNEIPVLGNLVTAKSHYCETIETVKSQQWGKNEKTKSQLWELSGTRKFHY